MRKAVWLVVWLVAGVAQADGSLTLTGIEQQRFDEFGCLGSDFGYNHYRLYQVEGLDWQGSLAEAILTEANVYKRDNGGTPEYATFRGYLAQLDTPKETQFVIEQLISQIGLPTFPQTEKRGNGVHGESRRLRSTRLPLLRAWVRRSRQLEQRGLGNLGVRWEPPPNQPKPLPSLNTGRKWQPFPNRVPSSTWAAWRLLAGSPWRGRSTAEESSFGKNLAPSEVPRVFFCALLDKRGTPS